MDMPIDGYNNADSDQPERERRTPRLNGIYLYYALRVFARCIHVECGMFK